MKTFVVGFLSFFDNEIVLEKIQAENEVEAVKKHSHLAGYEFLDLNSVSDIDYELSNSDITVSILEL